jgi:predicted DNA-binding transcriptional regulator AlpA
MTSPLGENAMPQTLNAAERHEPQMLSAAAVAQLLDTTPLVVRRLAANGRFPQPVRLNRKCARWPRQVVEAWITNVASPRPAAGGRAAK